MKRVVISAAVLSLAVAGTGLASAGNPTTGQGAQKAGLFPKTTDSMDQCDAAEGGDTAAPAAGFTILNGVGKTGAIKKIVGQVSLKEGVPGTTYMVFLAQAGDCQMTGTLTTNGQGNGNSHIDTSKLEMPAPVASGTYYVVLRTGMQMFASSPVLVS